MSWHDPLAARKPRRSGLYLPFVLLLAGVAVWTVFWLSARRQIETQMDTAVRDLARAGYQLGWSRREIGGYPFRMDVTLTDASVRERSGWGLQAPILEGEAYAYASGHWMLAAPQGLSFVRPAGGAVTVTGKLLRASLTHLEQNPPSVDVQGENLTFRPAAGAEPFALSAAELFELHLRAGPDDQGGVFVQLTNGRARLAGLFGRIAGEKPISLTWNATLSKMSAFTGANWAGAVRHWSQAGGLMNVRESSQLTAGDAFVQVRSGSLGVDDDGRLRGALQVALRQAPRALDAMAATGVVPYASAEAARAVASGGQAGDAVRTTIHFEAGQTTLGPVALGPAPRVCAPR